MENINIKVILDEVFGTSCYAELKRRKANKSAK